MVHAVQPELKSWMIRIGGNSRVVLSTYARGHILFVGTYMHKWDTGERDTRFIIGLGLYFSNGNNVNGNIFFKIFRSILKKLI